MVKNFMMTVPRDELVRIQNTLEGKNSDLKVATFKNLLFKAETKQLVTKTKSIEVMKVALLVASKLLLTKTYGNENGNIQWAVMKETIEDVKKEMDKAAGREEARAEVAAAAGLMGE